jgi:type IV pilus assembly protein PilY1
MKKYILAVLVLSALLGSQGVDAAATDISSVPVMNITGTGSIKPNLMMMLDDSGSMAYDYTPDAVNDTKTCFDGVACKLGYPPYNSSDFNYQYYNPDVTYQPAINSDGTSKGSQTTFTAVQTDPFLSPSSTKNLLTSYGDYVYCTSSSDSVTDSTKCKKNYAWLYPQPSSSTYRSEKAISGPPYYYRIVTSKYCSTSNLTNCVSSTVPTAGYTFAAPVRWCDASSSNISNYAFTQCEDSDHNNGTYNYNTPEFVGQVKAASGAVAAYATLDIGTAGSTYSITSMQAAGVNIINTTVTGNTAALTATSLVNAINSYNSTPEYRACIGTQSADNTCTGTPTNRVTIFPETASGGTTALTGAATNGTVITYAGPTGTPAVAASGTLTIGAGSAGTLVYNLGSIYAGATAITTALSGSWDLSTTADQQALAQTIAAAIGSGYSATATNGVVTVTANTPGAAGNQTLSFSHGTSAQGTGTITVNTGVSGSKTYYVTSIFDGATNLAGAFNFSADLSTTAGKNSAALAISNKISASGFSSSTSSTNKVTITAPAGGNNGVLTVNTSATTATGSITVNALSAGSYNYVVNNVKVGGTTISTGAASYTGDLSTAAGQQGMASAIAANIGNGYSATATSGVVNITANATGSALNGTLTVSPVSGTAATGTITVTPGASGASVYKINNIKVGGTTISSGVSYTGDLSIPGGSSSTGLWGAATAIAASIGSGYSAVATSNGVVTVTATATGTGGNGALSVTAPAATPAMATGPVTITVNSGSNSTYSTPSIKVGSTVISSGSISQSGLNSTNKQNSLATSIASSINSAGLGYSASTGTGSNQNVVTITPSSAGSYPNGQTVSITSCTGWFCNSIPATISGTFSGGSDAGMGTSVSGMAGGSGNTVSTTLVNMTGGTDALPLTVAGFTGGSTDLYSLVTPAGLSGGDNGSGTVGTTPGSGSIIFANGINSNSVPVRVNVGTFVRTDLVPCVGYGTGTVNYAPFSNNITVAAASSNHKFNIAVDGGAAVTVTVPDGTYNYVNISSVLQTALNSSTLGSGKVTVYLDSNNHLHIASTNTAAGSAVALTAVSGNTGLANIIGTPTVAAGGPTVACFPKDPVTSQRTDCAATAGCTYNEEMTNFSNWYAYYQTRSRTMKSAAGLAFQPLSSNYRVGFSLLSTIGYTNGSGNYTVSMYPTDFNATAKSTWYSYLYNSNPSVSTPLQQALDNLGLMFANQGDFVQTGTNRVIQYPCQQNFVIMTTDGFWNQTYSGSVVNNDNVANASRFCTKANGCLDGYTGSSPTSPSLADIALYWYNGGSNTSTTSLRTDLDSDMTKPGVVPTTTDDPNTHLHMTTFTLGLGVSGLLNYEKNYNTAPMVGGDYYNLVTGASGCPWNSGGTYVWPNPVANDLTAVDDLWHAAVNGHGRYFSARNPNNVISGLSTAIAAMSVRTGAASASATSTPNVTQQDNAIFSATFTTVKWNGDLYEQNIDPATGAVSIATAWDSTATLAPKISSAADTRTIYMLDTTSYNLKNFLYSEMSTTEKGWFNNKASQLIQYYAQSAADQVVTNSGTNLVNYFRGQTQYANDNIYRAYQMTSPTATPPNTPIVLGDIVNAKPAYLRLPNKSYSFGNYSGFIIDQAARPGIVFAAANDGFMHAFLASDSGTLKAGTELWAYAPRIPMAKLYHQASTDYGSNHQYTVDGSPEVGDVQINGQWASVLVAGLNAGGRGYYALDVTDPKNPQALWELCADPSICSSSDKLQDGDLGFTFGNPQFGMWNGTWVVLLTSGYNNVPGTDGVSTGSGHGILYIVDVSSGQVLKKIDTGVGDTTTPAGLAKITAVTDNPQSDPNITYVYGGDNLGNLWRFDMTGSTSTIPAPIKLATLGSGQPITTRPSVSLCQVGTALQRVVLTGTGRLLGVSDTTSTGTQSLYMIKDTGTALGSLNGASSMVQQTLTANTGGSTYSISNYNVDLTTKNGWWVDFTMNSGERVNLDPKVLFDTAVVATNDPTSASNCAIGGTSYYYQLDLCTGSYVGFSNGSGRVPGSGGTGPTNSAGQVLSNSSAAVGFIVVSLPSGKLEMITTLASGDKPTQPVTANASATPRKTGWRSVRN